MNVIFRTISNSEVGAGHFVRCLNLAEALSEYGLKIYFACKELEKRDQIKLLNLGYNFIEIPPTCDIPTEILVIQSKIDNHDPSAVVFDDYEIDYRWDIQFKSLDYITVAFEEMHEYRRNVDVLIDMNFRTKSEAEDILRLHDAKYFFVGTEFVILSSLYLKNGKFKKFRNTRKGTLIHFGTLDEFKLTETLTSLILQRFPKEKVLTIVSSKNIDIIKLEGLQSEYKNLELLIFPQNLSYAISQTDISIGAGGISLWEKLSSGLYGITVATATNQIRPLESLASEGFIDYFGEAKEFSVENIISKYSQIRNSSDSIQKRANRVSTLFDSLGKDKVASKIFNLLENRNFSI